MPKARRRVLEQVAEAVPASGPGRTAPPGACRPPARASVVVDNTDLAAPRLVERAR